MAALGSGTLALKLPDAVTRGVATTLCVASKRIETRRPASTCRAAPVISTCEPSGTTSMSTTRSSVQASAVIAPTAPWGSEEVVDELRLAVEVVVVVGLGAAALLGAEVVLVAEVGAAVLVTAGATWLVVAVAVEVELVAGV